MRKTWLRGLWHAPWLFVGAPAASAACADAAPDTAGERVVLATRLEAKGAAGFTNAHGYDVKLERALLATGPLYYFDGAPLARRARDLLLPVVHAHPGHYQPGEAAGEMLEEWSVDLLALPAALPEGRGVTRPVRSATFGFGEVPAGPVQATLQGHVVLLEGSAKKDTSVVAFRAVADLPDVKSAEGRPLVEGCAFAPATLAAGTVVLEIDLTRWLDQVDFGTLAPAAGSGPASFESGSPAHKDFVRGLKKAASYHFRFERTAS